MAGGGVSNAQAMELLKMQGIDPAMYQAQMSGIDANLLLQLQ